MLLAKILPVASKSAVVTLAFDVIFPPTIFPVTAKLVPVAAPMFGVVN